MLSKDYKKPVPFRNHYYFRETVFLKCPAAPAAVSIKQENKQLADSATQTSNGDDNPPPAKQSPVAKKTSAPAKQSPAAKKTSAPAKQSPVAKKMSAPAKQSPAAKKTSTPAKQSPAAKLPAEPTQSAITTRRKPPAKEPVPSLPTIPEEQHNDDNSSDAFMIDRPRKTAAAKLKRSPKLQVVNRNQRILNRAASAPGQRKVSDFYFVDPNDSNNLEYLPDIEHDVTFATRDVPCSCTIVISDDSTVSQSEGPRHVSSPTLDTQMFDYPMLSPINSIECIVITDSSQDLFT